MADSWRGPVTQKLQKNNGLTDFVGILSRSRCRSCNVALDRKAPFRLPGVSGRIQRTYLHSYTS